MSILSRIIDSFKYLDKNGLKKLAALTERMFRFKTMPDAAARWEGKLVQYIGPTNAAYHRGYFYTCVDNAGTYEWQRTDTQPNGDIVLWDGTHAQYEAEQDGIPEGAYLNFTDDYDSNVEVGVYSTRETKTGELFLDKPVYRKVFLFSSPVSLTASTWGTLTTGMTELNIKKLIKAVPLSPQNGTCVANDLVQINGDTLQMYTTGYSISIDCITIEYTKTTD